MLHLRTLGGLWIADGEHRRVGRSLGRKPLALLALVARTERRSISRDRVLALLWPEKDIARARNALNQVVFLLRRALGVEILAFDRYEIAFAPDAVRDDVSEFHEATAQRAWEVAARLYAGPFLEGFYVPDAGEFERWAEEERVSLRFHYLRALEGLATAAESRADAHAAVEWWRRLAAAEPLSARVTVALMRALTLAGERATAIRVAEAHATRVRSELDAAVDARVMAMLDAIRARADVHSIC